jgi:phosphoglycolate phosphatase-like HAD superfamily hydrolase
VGVISSNAARNVWRFCAGNEFPRLDFVQSSGVFGKARALRRLASRYRVQPEQIIYIGDETRDIEAARKAGVLSAAVTWGGTDEAVLRDYNPDFVFSTPDEILSLV